MKFKEINSIFQNWNWVFILVFILLFSQYPYVFSSFLSLPYNIGIELIWLFLFFIMYSQLHPKRSFSPALKIIIIAQIMVWLIYTLMFGALMYTARCIRLITAFYMILCLLNSKGNIEGFFRKYNGWVFLMALGATIGFILIAFFHMQPISDFEQYDGRTGNFFGVTCAHLTWMTYLNVRVSGFFDEAGALASWGIFALVINRMISNTRYENIFLSLLLSTLSLGYFVQGSLYLLSTKVKKMSTMIFCFVFVALFAFLTFTTQNTKYDFLYNMTWGRVEYDETEGTFSGNSRYELTKLAKQKFEKEPVFGVGGIEFHKEYMDDNPYESLGRDGIVGTFFLYLPLIYALILCMKKKRFDLCMLIVVIAIGYLQRPIKDNMLHTFMLYSLVVLIEKNVRNRIVEN